MSDLIDDVLANPIVGAAGSAFAIAGVALWIAAAWWAWRDAARRSESSTVAFIASGWIIVSTPMLLPLSLAVYAVTRPQTTAAEHRAESLVAAIRADVAAGSACPSCAARIDSSWVRCPACTSWLAAPCSNCGEWSAAGLELCPFCGHEGQAAPVVEEPRPVVEEPRPAVAAFQAARRAPRMGVPVPRQSGI